MTTDKIKRFPSVALLISLFCFAAAAGCDEEKEEETNYCELREGCQLACAKLTQCGSYSSASECYEFYFSSSASGDIHGSYCEYYYIFDGTTSYFSCSSNDNYMEGGNCGAITDCDDFISCLGDEY